MRHGLTGEFIMCLVLEEENLRCAKPLFSMAVTLPRCFSETLGGE